MLLTNLLSLWRARKRPVPPKSRSSRPSLEALEDRLLPSTTWQGTISTDPTVPGNWSNGLPTTQEAVFDNTATRGLELGANQALSVGKLTIANNYTLGFTVAGAFSLTLGQVAGNSTDASASVISVKQGGKFNVLGNGTFVVSGGGFSTDATRAH